MSRYHIHLMLKDNGNKSPSHPSNGPFKLCPRGLAKGGVAYYVINGKGWRAYKCTEAKCEAWIERMNLAYAKYLMVKP